SGDSRRTPNKIPKAALQQNLKHRRKIPPRRALSLANRPRRRSPPPGREESPMCPHRTLRRTVFALAVLATSFLTAAPLQADEKVYARAVKSTVIVEAPKSLGAGALIDASERLVVTANHVVANDKDVSVYFAASDAQGRPVTDLKHYAANQERLRLKGTVVARLERCDLALIQLDALPPGTAATPLAAQG